MTDPAVADQTEQQYAPGPTTTPPPVQSVSANGRTQIFDNVTQSLSDAELTNPTVAKLLIYMLKNAEAEREDYKKYVTLYYEADKKAGVLEVKKNGDKENEITFAVGVGLGGAVLGVAPVFFDKSSTLPGSICLALGAVLLIGAIVSRARFGSSK